MLSYQNEGLGTRKPQESTLPSFASVLSWQKAACLINTNSPVISPRLIQPIGLRPHSVLTEQRLFSPIHIPSSSFLQPIPPTSAYTPPALCNDPHHQQLLPSIKEELGRMSELLQYIASHVTQLSSSSQSYMPQHIKSSAAEKGSQASSSLSAVRTDADFEVLEDFLSEDSNVKCFVCVPHCLSSDLFLSGAVHEPAWWNIRRGDVAQHPFAQHPRRLCQQDQCLRVEREACS
ncbi:hypothetical protein EG68_11841 [Paragonimus skrjabini miyazakii]|uniref:Uncharacterized protein n=1 Tax=Paragonimus skrjabini miyazakii TaxID=59628 RepID=A0A8S9YDW2_9TREM|nr:hypothetical protein EG68_11841 [Paragonimus skrjabini miyazakii]